MILFHLITNKNVSGLLFIRWQITTQAEERQESVVCACCCFCRFGVCLAALPLNVVPGTLSKGFKIWLFFVEGVFGQTALGAGSLCVRECVSLSGGVSKTRKI